MKNFKKIASLVLILVVVFLNRSTPSIGATVPILNGSFTNGTDASGSDWKNISDWEEKGDENNSSTLGKNPGSDDDSASPDAGRFASISRYNSGTDGNGWICQEIDADGYNSLVLKYYWRGDADAEDDSDTGRIEYNTNGSCESADNQWTLVTSHELDNGNTGVTAWSSLQSLSLPGALSDSEFFIRFRGNVSANDESFRVDGVSLEGTPIPSTLIVKKVVTNNSGGSATAASFSFSVNGGASTAFEGDAQNNITVVPGTYSVVEDPAPGYTTTYSGCSNVSVGIGQTKTCTVTNNDKPDICENIQGWQYEVPEGYHQGDDDDDDDECFPNTATISATKIVCDSESDLPNWGDGSPSTNITSSTAANFIAAHPNNCHLQSDWNFEWAPSNAPNPGNQVGAAGGAWTVFGPTNGSGVATATVPYGSSVWVREQANANYIPFSGDTSSSGGWSDTSAEMYCGTDVLNYDNYDKVTSPSGGSTYHCVAFNVAKPDVCPNIPELQTTVPEGYHVIHTNDQAQCVPDYVDVQLCKTNDAGEPQPLSGWTVKLDGEGENDHQGVTGQNGCYTFNDIPYGNYTASEVMQEGWTQVSLPNENGTIQAYSPQNGPYYIVNHYNAPVCDPQVNLIQNGGFEAPALPPSSWSIIPDTDSLLKWLVAWVGTQTSGNLGLEIQNNVAGLPAEGSQHAELDGDHPVSIWQTIPTIPGKVYHLNFKYSARPGRDANDNKIEVKAAGVTLGAVLSDDGTSLSNTSWGVQSRSFIATGATTKVEFVDTGTDTSFGGYLDAVSLTCDPNPKATINAKKIVCDSESDLPNWGAGGADITATTASDYVASHPSCHLEPWTFEWAPNGTGNPGDNTAVAGGAWTPFTSSVQVPAGNLVWVREQTQSGYVPFTGENTDQNVSAEIYCHTDVLNYDNYDWINPVEPIQTYYCVAFNAVLPPPPPSSCDANLDLVLNGSLENGAADIGAFVSLNGVDTTSITNWSVDSGSVDYIGGYWQSSDGSRNIDLNGLAAGSISQTIPTTIGDTYTVTFDLSGNPDSAEGENFSPSAKVVRVGATGATSTDYTYDTAVEGNTKEDMKWQAKSYTFVATSTSTVITFASQITGAFGPAVDNIKIKCTPPPPSDGKVHIFKFVDGLQATTEMVNGVSFPMNTPTYGDAPFTLDPDGWTEGDAPYEASTSTISGGGTYTAYENLTTQLVGASCEAENPPAYELVGYSYGNTLEAAKTAIKTLSAPTVTVNGDKYIIVWNKKCGEVLGASTLKVHIYKYLYDGESATQVADNSPDVPSFPMTATWQTANLDGGTSTSGSYVLGNNHGGAALQFAADTSPMEAPADYTTTEVTDGSVVVPTNSESCPAGKYRLLGYKSGDSLSEAQSATLSSTAPVYTDIMADRYIIVVNEKCGEAPSTTANLSAVKIICPAEATLPNWSGSEMTINANTAAEFIEEHPTCHIDPNWQFEWSLSGNENDPSDNQEVGGSGWTPFTGSTTIPSGGTIWVREQHKSGYIPFTGSEGGPVSAELWCYNDVLNYDNLDFVSGVSANTTYHCVGFNVPTQQETPTGPSDVCPNLPEVQTQVPGGYHINDGQCVPNGAVGGGGLLNFINSGGQPQVLGASTTCTPYLEDYLKRGGKNRKEQVIKLQTFLNDYLKLNPPLTVNGIFGLQTYKAVIKFQEQESDLVLKPWIGITLKDAKKGTGWVFKTTRTRINNIMCPELNLQNPPLTLN